MDEIKLKGADLIKRATQVGLLPEKDGIKYMAKSIKDAGRGVPESLNTIEDLGRYVNFIKRNYL